MGLLLCGMQRANGYYSEPLHFPRMYSASMNTMAEPTAAPSRERMTALELRASASLASIFALRMLGLFLILPVFAVHARGIPGGQSGTLVGVAIGIYGLTQGFLQIPFGIASDRWGRKPVMIAGLILFAVGSLVAAMATDIVWTIVGRAIQGSGAISAAVTAMIADATRDSQRTKAMAMVGGSIGLTFAVSLVGAPVLYQAIGMGGIFGLTGLLAVLAIGVVAWVVPHVEQPFGHEPVPFATVLRNPDLLRLDLGIFVLHMAQMAMFVVVPVLLVDVSGIPVAEHWTLYLPAVLGSFLLMVPAIFYAERRGKVKQVFLGGIALMLVVEGAAAWLASGQPGMWPMLALLLAFFVAFNILEAMLPSLISRLAPPAAKGAALGVYNTVQAIGLFAGGALGGWIASHLGRAEVFEACAVLLAAWFFAALGMRVPARVHAQSK
jgi:predicted MFS family arabinose efflux permease